MWYRSLFFVVLLVNMPSASAFVGMNFALKLQKNRLATTEAAWIIREAYSKVTRFKMFDYDAQYVSALAAAGATDVMVAVPNGELASLGKVTYAEQIVTRLAPFVTAGMTITLAVGNEPLAPWYNGRYAPHLVPAVTNVRQAIASLGHAGTIKVTVPHYFGLLSSSYPPTAGAFHAQYVNTITSVARMLRDDGSVFCINIYPFFAYRFPLLSHRVLQSCYLCGRATTAPTAQSRLHNNVGDCMVIVQGVKNPIPYLGVCNANTPKIGGIWRSHQPMASQPSFI